MNNEINAKNIFLKQIVGRKSVITYLFVPHSVNFFNTHFKSIVLNADGYVEHSELHNGYVAALIGHNHLVYKVACENDDCFNAPKGKTVHVRR